MQKKLIIIFILIMGLFSCKKIEFKDAKCEEITNVLDYNELVKKAAAVTFENYYFIDLRSDIDYRGGYISNFYPSNHIPYESEETIDKIINHINETNKASFTAPIVLLSSGYPNDSTSTIVYDLLMARGYKNLKNVVIGYKGLYEGYEIGFPYSLRDGSDCGC